MRYWLSDHQWVIHQWVLNQQSIAVEYVLYIETVRYDAIVVVTSTVVDGMISGFTSLILGFGFRVCIAMHRLAAWRCVGEAR